LNIPNKNELISKGIRRPYNSENGAHTIGPRAKPKTYRDTPRVPTSTEKPKTLEIVPVAAEKIELPNAAQSVT